MDPQKNYKTGEPKPWISKRTYPYGQATKNKVIDRSLRSRFQICTLDRKSQMRECEGTCVKYMNKYEYSRNFSLEMTLPQVGAKIES